MAEWTTVGSASEIDEGDVQAYEVGDLQIAVARIEGELHAFSDICTHRRCTLSSSDLDATTIECECHGSVFDVITGEVLEGPANEPIETYEVRVEDDDLQIGV
jgi:3-phenylpropionate/trans-cinnamate dioxygenase ferredoxin component